MSRIIIPLFGPFAIHSFGLMIALGVMIFTILITRDPRRKQLISSTALSDAIALGLLAGIIGGRLLAILGDEQLRSSSFTEWISTWDGGLSSLGCVMGVLGSWLLYLYYRSIPLLPFLDLAAIYAPIIHIFVRIGCLLAGCCYGCPTSSWWSITYHDVDTLAPTGVALHPTQLYSIGLLLCILIFMQYISSKPTIAGQLLGWYLLLTNAERFMTDFFRGDREFIPYTILQYLSLHQWLALGLACCGLALLIRSRSIQPPTPRS